LCGGYRKRAGGGKSRLRTVETVVSRGGKSNTRGVKKTSREIAGLPRGGSRILNKTLQSPGPRSCVRSKTKTEITSCSAAHRRPFPKTEVAPPIILANNKKKGEKKKSYCVNKRGGRLNLAGGGAGRKRIGYGSRMGGKANMVRAFSERTRVEKPKKNRSRQKREKKVRCLFDP